MLLFRSGCVHSRAAQARRFKGQTPALSRARRLTVWDRVSAGLCFWDAGSQASPSSARCSGTRLPRHTAFPLCFCCALSPGMLDWGPPSSSAGRAWQVSPVFAWRTHGKRSLVGPQSTGSHCIDMTGQLSSHARSAVWPHLYQLHLQHPAS